MSEQRRAGGPLADAWHAAFTPRPILVAKVAEGCPVRYWAEQRCGSCGRMFTADPKSLPLFGTSDGGQHGICLSCWDRRNRLRAAIGEPASARPMCYPEDYPPES
jgi:hypothetical protein